MEAGSTILGRLGEKVLGWVALGLLLLLGYAVYQTPADQKQAIWNGFWATLLWLALAAGLPWSGKLYLRRISEVGANWVGAALIAGLTLLDVLLGWWLVTWLSGGWGLLIGLAGVTVVGIYNYLVLEYLADTAGI